jgi:protoheme ferro-lyase
VQQAEQEPVAWALSHSMGLEFGSKYPMQETKEAAEQMARQHMGAVVVTPLYAAPVRTKNLTDDEIGVVIEQVRRVNPLHSKWDFARAVIAADREKNK